MTDHVVSSTPQTVRSGFLDSTAVPVARIRSGSSVTLPDTWTPRGNEATYGMTFAEREPLRHRYPSGPYSMLGPVHVENAAPDTVIECTIDQPNPIGWGWNSLPLGVGGLPADFEAPYLYHFQFDESRTTTEYVSGITLDLHPFVGVIGTEPAGDDPVSAILCGPCRRGSALPDASRVSGRAK